MHLHGFAACIYGENGYEYLRLAYSPNSDVYHIAVCREDRYLTRILTTVTELLYEALLMLYSLDLSLAQWGYILTNNQQSKSPQE